MVEAETNDVRDRRDSGARAATRLRCAVTSPVAALDFGPQQGSVSRPPNGPVLTVLTYNPAGGGA